MNYGPPATASYHPPERDNKLRVEHNLADVALSFQTLYSRCLDLGSRIGNLADFVAGGSPTPSNQTAAPREVPNGIVATLSETRESLSYLLDRTEVQVERISRSLGIDLQPSTR